ncbi:hypothetical protein C1645_880533 [Glomus cerebriforme]|uniref:BTB domain-containing protein n=1 Tax=Glomus cerebriforme TaxID=658196 RepID=A0A397SLB9_9GLOM|nr:hypothetical protein C1645_880533 [Glomus cerebriforme]
MIIRKFFLLLFLLYLLPSIIADNKFLPKLSQNLLEILDDNKYYDITIEVGNDSYVKVFRAHMVILNYRSSYLRKILTINEKGYDGTLAHIKLQNITPEIFQIILRYIYGGILPLEDYDTSDVIKILVAANNLEKFLITLIQNANLRMSGIQVWEHIIRWGIAQNPDLTLDPSIYSNDDFNALKNTLKQIIPFIKFTDFTAKEFLEKIYHPYKKILPEELQENLIECFLNNDYKPIKKSEINLKIIISKWISRLEITIALLVRSGGSSGF